MAKKIDTDAVISDIIGKKEPVAKMEAFELEDEDMEELDEGMEEEKKMMAESLITAFNEGDPEGVLMALEELIGSIV